MTNLKTKHIEQWSLLNAVALSLCVIITLLFKELLPLFIIFTISLLGLFFIYKKELSKLNFGIANTITLLRYVLIILSFYFLNLNKTNLFLFGLITAVILDFFDGKAARYFKESSVFGQYFDMEIDAFFVLIMCLYYFIYENFYWWILIPGVLRYVYCIYTFCIPRQVIKTSKTNYGTIIAASFFIILLVGLVTSNLLQVILLGLGSVAIFISFAIGFIQYHKKQE